MYETRKKGYHQTNDRHCIIAVVGTAFFHFGKTEGIFKQCNGFRDASKKIKQVAEPETKIAIEIKRQHRICGGKDHRQKDQRDLAVKISICPAKTDDRDEYQKISQNIRCKIQSKDGTDDLIDYHIYRIRRFRCKGDEWGIGDGSF